MVQEQPDEEQPDEGQPMVIPDEKRPGATSKRASPRVGLHIYMPTEAYEQIKDWARYATLEGLMRGHPRGNYTAYCNFCLNLGEQYIKQHMLRKRGYK